MNLAFSKKLLQWNKQENKRIMPWKGETDPYKIWLSEIILQQTRVEQGWSYYEKFIKTFPTVNDLAKASEKKIFKLWEGLGYYNRCKNLIATAKKISKRNQGKFPETYDEIKNLKGVGPYTAAAITSFAFNLPYAVVDGNVERILSRYFAIDTPVDTAEGKKMYNNLANALLDKKNPSIYNQAIMDFGATICKPRNPLCTQCPQHKDCQSYQHNLVNLLPVKAKKLTKKQRWLYYFIIELGDAIYIGKRIKRDIWENLYEFVLFETNQAINREEMLSSDFLKNILIKTKMTIDKISDVYKQQLTHQTIHVQFIHIIISKPVEISGYFTVNKKDIGKYPFPKSIAAHLKQSEMF